ncbi:hypothetical protein [Bacillus amyloliquefaciens]|uniref:hypothetical protein n=1 Tax=Bacillus amyloliquefaciens TaxID=1390 RepID=UPI000ACE3612|nr:hypothetical protein [Bacillus amyloliquefaciens]
MKNHEELKQEIVGKIIESRRGYRLAVARPDLLNPYHELQELRRLEKALRDLDEKAGNA